MSMKGTSRLRQASRSASIALVLIVVGNVVPANGQIINVGVEMQGDESGLQRTLIAELEKTPNVALATISSMDYVLRMAVQCLPAPDSCATATTYAVAVVIAQPYPRSVVLGSPTQAGPALVRKESAGDAPLWTSRGVEVFQTMWVSSWSRATAAEQIAAMVADIDERCFERRRVFLQYEEAERTGAAAATQALWNLLQMPGRWMCR